MASMASKEKERLKTGAWLIGSALGVLLLVHLYVGEYLLFRLDAAVFLSNFGYILAWPPKFMANMIPAITIPWIIYLLFQQLPPRAARLPSGSSVPYRTFSRIVLIIGIYLVTILTLAFFEYSLPGSISDLIGIVDGWVETFWLWSVIGAATLVALYVLLWLIEKIGPWLWSSITDLVAIVLNCLRAFFTSKLGKCVLIFLISGILAAFTFAWLKNRYGHYIESWL